MINGIRIANFKAFGSGIQRCPIKPITLLFGPNSAGKSSVIHSMALAHEVSCVDSNNLDVVGTRVGGRTIDLGGFRQYLHRGLIKERVLLGFDVEVSGSRLLVGTQVSVEVKFGLEGPLPQGDPRVIQIRILVRNETWKDMSADDEQFCVMSLRPGTGGFAIDRLNTDHPLYRLFVANAIQVVWETNPFRTPKDKEDKSDKFDWLPDEMLSDAGAVVDAMIPDWEVTVNGLLPERLGLADKKASSLRMTDLGPAKLFREPEGSTEGSEGYFGLVRKLNQISRPQPTTIEDLETFKGAVQAGLPVIVDQFIADVSESIVKSIKGFTYLGPIRYYPTRHASLQESDPDYAAGGGPFWRLLLENENVRRRVNAWLQQHQDPARYELRQRTYLPKEELMEELKGSLPDFLAQLDDDLRYYWSQGVSYRESLWDPDEEEPNPYEDDDDEEDYQPEPENQEMTDEKEVQYRDEESESFTAETIKRVEQRLKEKTRRELIVHDLDSHTDLSARDIGLGFSQLIPILVSAFARGQRLIAIEEPESQLHPALAADLGDVFIESALGDNRNRFILETHSEHLMLRLLKRIRQTSENKLPEGCPPVSPNDVAVLYIEPGESGSRVIEIPIAEDGEFETSWPKGFFDERLEEYTS